MPDFKSFVAQRIVTLRGHIFNVAAGEVFHVPDEAASDVASRGCAQVGEAPAPVVAPPAPPAEEPAAADEVLEAVRLLVAESRRESFASNGRPKVQAVRDLLPGKTVGYWEVNKAFEALVAETGAAPAEEPPPLLPDAA